MPLRILLHIFQSLLFEMECLCCISLFKSSNEIPGDKGETTVLSAKQDSTSKPLPISVVVYTGFFNHTSFYSFFGRNVLIGIRQMLYAVMIRAATFHCRKEKCLKNEKNKVKWKY